MRILVLSDSHGCVEPMEQCVERVQPQVILHLGDCVRDAQRLEERYPDIPLLGVPGNCDYGGLDQPERLTELGGVRILMMHGHTRRVKSGPMAAIYSPAVRAHSASLEQMLLLAFSRRMCCSRACRDRTKQR